MSFNGIPLSRSMPRNSSTSYSLSQGRRQRGVVCINQNNSVNNPSDDCIEEEQYYLASTYNDEEALDNNSIREQLGISRESTGDHTAEEDDDDGYSELTHIRDDYYNDDFNIIKEDEHDYTTDHNHHYRECSDFVRQIPSHSLQQQSKRTRHHAHLMLQMGGSRGGVGASRRLSGVSSATSHGSQYSVSESSVRQSHTAFSGGYGSTTVGVDSDFFDDELQECYDDTSDLEVCIFVFIQ